MTDRELFHLLKGELELPDSLRENHQNMAGFRNLLVHGYQTVDRRILRHILETNLDDLLAFVQLMRNRYLG